MPASCARCILQPTPVPCRIVSAGESINLAAYPSSPSTSLSNYCVPPRCIDTSFAYFVHCFPALNAFPFLRLFLRSFREGPHFAYISSYARYFFFLFGIILFLHGVLREILQNRFTFTTGDVRPLISQKKKRQTTTNATVATMRFPSTSLQHNPQNLERRFRCAGAIPLRFASSTHNPSLSRPTG
jgi:hypothetical protein